VTFDEKVVVEFRTMLHGQFRKHPDRLLATRGVKFSGIFRRKMAKGRTAARVFERTKQTAKGPAVVEDVVF
jgi:hypothetical protein